MDKNPTPVGPWLIDATWPVTHIRLLNMETGEMEDFGRNDGRNVNRSKAKLECEKRNKKT